MRALFFERLTILASKMREILLL